MMHRNGKTIRPIRPVDFTPLAMKQKTPLPILKKKQKKFKIEKVADWAVIGFLMCATIYFLAHLVMWALRGFKVYGL